LPPSARVDLEYEDDPDSDVRRLAKDRFE
jgi:hypothetical protein